MDPELIAAIVTGVLAAIFGMDKAKTIYTNRRNRNNGNSFTTEDRDYLHQASMGIAGIKGKLERIDDTLDNLLVELRVLNRKTGDGGGNGS